MADFFILPISDPMMAASHPLLPAHPVPEGARTGPSLRAAAGQAVSSTLQ